MPEALSDYNRAFTLGIADKAVSLADLGAFAATFDQSSNDPSYNPNFDFTCDGTVTLSDLGFFSTHYQHQCQ